MPSQLYPKSMTLHECLAGDLRLLGLRLPVTLAAPSRRQHGLDRAAGSAPVAVLTEDTAGIRAQGPDGRAAAILRS